MASDLLDIERYLYQLGPKKGHAADRRERRDRRRRLIMRFMIASSVMG